MFSMCFFLAPFKLTAKPQFWFQHGSNGPAVADIWCLNTFTSLGTCQDSQLNFLNNYITFKLQIAPFVFIKRATLMFGYGDNVNREAMEFTVNVANVILTADTECRDDLIRTHRFGNLKKVRFQGMGDSDTGAIDVTELVQWEVSNDDWHAEKDEITFVISQKHPNCTSGEKIIFDGAASMVLNIFYDDFKPRKLHSEYVYHTSIR